MSPHHPPAPASPRLFPLIWPLYLEMWLGVLVGLLGTLLAARQSDAAGAALALANQVGTALFMVFRVVGAGVSVALTQRLGAGQQAGAHAVARAALGAASWIGGVLGLACAWGAPLWLGWMQAPPEVAELAQPLLQSLGVALLLDAWTAVMSAVVRAHLHARPALGVMLLMQTSQLLLMPVLMQALGLAGFALAMGLSRLLGLALLLGLWRRLLALRPRWSDAWRLPRAELVAVMRIGLPAAAEEMAWRLAFMASLAVAAQLGAQALATHAYVMQLMHAVLLLGAATGVAIEIAIGHRVGAGQLRQADALLRRALGGGLLAVALLALAVALNGRWLLSRFTNDPVILDQGSTLLWLTLGVETGRVFNLVVINALRAAGDVRFPLLAGLLSMPVVLAGGSWLLGLHLGWGLAGLWVAYAADEWLRGLMMWLRWRSRVWLPRARAVHRRLRA